MSYALFFWQMIGPIKIHNRGELSIFKVFRTNSASMECPFLGRFWARTLPQILPDSAKIFPTGSIQGKKNSALRIFEKLKFLQKREIPRVYTFGPTLVPFFPSRKWPNLKKKTTKIGGKDSPIGIS